MAYLKQSSCSAAIAFSPSEALLATGTYIGTTDINFEEHSALEVSGLAVERRAAFPQVHGSEQLS